MHVSKKLCLKEKSPDQENNIPDQDSQQWRWRESNPRPKWRTNKLLHA